MIFLRAVPEVTVTVLLFVTIGNNDFNFRLCVKDMAGMESQHDPVTIDYCRNWRLIYFIYYTPN